MRKLIQKSRRETNWFRPGFCSGQKDGSGAYVDVMNINFALRLSAIQIIKDQLRKENTNE
jgi:hypothetical protein